MRAIVKSSWYGLCNVVCPFVPVTCSSGKWISVIENCCVASGKLDSGKAVRSLLAVPGIIFHRMLRLKHIW